MAGRTQAPIGLGWFLRLGSALLLALAFLVTDLAPVSLTSAASAQERPRTIMDMLFGGRPQRRYIDEVPRRRVIRKQQRQKQPQRVQRQKAARGGRKGQSAARAAPAAAAAAARPAPVAKSETARTVLVVGDFMAGSLAGGLNDALAKNPDVRVVSAPNGSSGLVRNDHYDWPAQIGSRIDEAKPAIVVAILGSNDRQPLEVAGQSLEPRSDAWMAEYERRATAFAKAVKDKNVPLVWVGMPSFKFDRMSEDMAALNEVYRKVATATGGEFVDVWDGFVDASGAFAYSGPDIAGQSARLRNSDGITMTPAGSEKLAFFAEKPIFRLLGTGVGGAATAPGEMSSLKYLPVANAATAKSAPVVGLDDPSLDGGDMLLGGGSVPGASPEPSPRDKLVVSGAPEAGDQGRADNFNWSAKTTAVIPLKPVDSVVFRGSVDLNSVREPDPRQPPKPMPSLADAIVEDWAAQNSAAPAAVPPAVPETPATAPQAPATTPAASGPAPAVPAAPVAPASASPFAQDAARQ